MKTDYKITRDLNLDKVVDTKITVLKIDADQIKCQ
jgi:hypothetical protein